MTIVASPTTLTTLTLAPASDSGTPLDDRTDVATPLITGTGGTSGEIVTLFAGSTALGSATVAIDGTWSVTASTLALGSHVLTASEADTNGDVSTPSTALTVTIDTPPLTLPTPVLSPGSDSGTLGDHHTDVTTPLITGTDGTDGDTVTLYDGITAIGTAIVAAGGAWSITTPTRTLGAHNFVTTQTDPYGNVSGEPDPLTVTIVASPTTLTTLTLAPASDSGTPLDDRTDVATPLITGAGGTSGEIVTLFAGSTALGSATVAIDGTWSVTASTLALGSHVLTASEADTNGDVSAPSTALTITIDTPPLTLPTPVLSPGSDSGTLGDHRTDITTPLITGTEGTVGDTVTLYDGLTAIGTAIVAAGGAWSITTPTRTLGAHNFVTTQTDPYGNVSGEPDPLTVTIVASPTTLTTLTLAPASDSGTPLDDRTDVATPLITGTGGTSGEIVTLFAGSTVLGSATVAINGTWSVTASTLALGSHVLTASEADTNGDVSAPSTALTITIDTPPLTLPTPVLSPGSDSGTLGDHRTDITTPLITGTEGTVGDTVTLYDGITAIGTAIVAPGGAWSITTPTRTLGAHNFVTTQTDPYGNVSGEPDPLTVTIDISPTTLTTLTLAPASDTGAPLDDHTDVATPLITGAGGTSGEVVTLFDAGTPVGSATVASGGTWSITTSTLVLGSHTLTASQLDAQGNISTASAPLTLTIDAIPVILTAPTLDPASDSGTLADDVTDIATPVIDGAGGTAGDTVTLYDGETAVGSAVVGSTGAWAATVSTLPTGSHTLTSIQTDGFGNPSLASPSLLLTIVPVPSTPASLTLAPASDSGSPGDDITNVTLPSITGSAPADSLIMLYNGAALIGTATANDSGAWSVLATIALSAGSNSLTATATDASGDVSGASAPLVVTLIDTAPPAPTLRESVDTTNPADPVIDGDAPSGNLVLLYQNGTRIGTATATDTGWSFTYPNALAAGSYTLNATDTDVAGNVSPLSANLVLQVDANNSYAVVTPVADSTNTKLYEYDTQGNLTTVETDNAQNQTLTSVSNTQAVINIYDTNGTLIGTITQPSTSAFSQPIFATTPDTLAASTGSGPVGSVVNLLAETNNFVSQGNDTITVQSGTATITATGPSTVVNNNSANVTFYGGDGTASVYGGSGTVTAVGGLGGGTLVGGTAGNNVLAAGGGTTMVQGVANGDMLFGSTSGTATDTLVAGAGTETLVGGAGTETLDANTGDAAFGGTGNSTLNGGANGGSTLVGGSGTSTLVAGGGTESMWAGSADSTMQGGSGPDVMGGSADINSTTLMMGGTGNDVFLGYAGNVTAVGGSGDDTFWTGSGSMTITEGAGTDTVVFGSGQASVTGGSGADTYTFLNTLAGGTDMIAGFKVGTDHIALFGYPDNAAQQSVSGGNTYVSLSDHTSIVLLGLTELPANSII